MVRSTPFSIGHILLSGIVGGVALSLKLNFAPMILAGLLAHVLATFRSGKNDEKLLVDNLAILKRIALVMMVISLIAIPVTLFLDLQGRLFPSLVRAFAAASLGSSTVFFLYFAFRHGWPNLRMSAVIQNGFVYVFGVLLGWFVLTAMIFENYRVLLTSIYGASRGLYSDRGIIDVYSNNIEIAVRLAPWWSAIALATIVLIAWRLRPARWRSPDTSAGEHIFGLAILLSIVFGLISTLRQDFLELVTAGSELRLFVPVAVSVVFGLAWLYKTWFSSVTQSAPKLLLSFALPVFVIVSFFMQYSSIMQYSSSLWDYEQNPKLERQQDTNAVVAAVINDVRLKLNREPVVVRWGLDVEVEFLRHGDEHTKLKFAEDLDKLFPLEWASGMTHATAGVAFGLSLEAVAANQERFDLFVFPEKFLQRLTESERRDAMTMLNSFGVVETVEVQSA